MANPTRTRNEVVAPKRGASRSTSDRRQSILALLLMAVALLLFLALVSYSAGDEAAADVRFSDLLKVFSGDPEVQAKADTAHNWLGLVGAIISDFLIKSTIGYSIFLLPILLMLYGWTLLRKGDFRRLIIITNYTLVSALLLSASFGMTRLIFGQETITMPWCGVVGDFLAAILAQLLGRVGGSILLVTSMFAVAVLIVDLDLRQTAERLKTWALMFMDWISRKKDAWQNARLAKAEGQQESEEETKVDQFPKPKSVVRISKPPLEEPIVFSKKAEFKLPPPVGLNKEEDESEVEERIPRLSADRPKEMRLEIEKKISDEEVNFDERPAAPRESEVPEEIDYVFPSVELLDPPRPGKEDVDDDELKANAALLRDTLAEFDVEVESVSVTPGPVVTLYELVPSVGVKISRIVSLENDIALKLAAKGIRIMAPIPGKSAVGVEIPNNNRALVTIRSVINSAKFRDTAAYLPLGLGKTVAGEVYTDDLSKMPHLLIAGSTGSGKSVGINTILASLLFRLHPSDLKLVIVDPKKIELAQYARLKDHFLAISPDTDEEIITTPRNAVLALKGVEYEMEKRYDRLAAAGVRNIVDYNERFKAGRLKNTAVIAHSKMPYLIIIIDELADLMITAAKEVEEPIARLAQLARAVGIHLIVATQRPSVDVITGVIKANFPARIAYQVASKTDSRTILDMNGAEQLLGNGDMLYLPSGSPKPVRLQNAFISTDEVDSLMEHIGKQKGYTRPFTLPSIVEKKRNAEGQGSGDRDELFDEAARLIVRHQQGSVSLLQRRLKVGYSRAARLVDELEAAGIVGPFDGSKAREVLVESESDLEAMLNS
jgi:DNA segregation ATPase FtsK/SpoIIIE, S-DNA-T family